jgi:DNA gyrase/topoisomerase IV subunit B
MKMKKMLENNVINNLSWILGLVHNQDDVDEKKIDKSPRYGHILLMMDHTLETW